MPKLVIDNIEVEVPSGTNVLEAAKQAGVVIPHFCYHPALGSVGACRLCAMKFLEGPVKGIQMSCMIPAQDGMVVSTTDGDAAKMRKLVIEWLMINHPHDCPVCDEGGECLLQDYTIAGGHGIRRYRGNKRTYLNQFLGPYIEHEMNRCIQCYRCVRFYQDYAGGTDFGVLGSAGRVYFGRFQEGQLQSPFSGNLVDICPTGVFTDKTARFRARYWDYDMAPSICPNCSLGCNTIPVGRYRELLKIMARRNDRINGWFICDRGRFDKLGVNDKDRPRTPLVKGQETTWDDANGSVISEVRQAIQEHGGNSIAIVGSDRLPMEALLLLPMLAQAIGTDKLCFFTSRDEADRTIGAVKLLTKENAAAMADVQNADVVIIMVCDLLAEGPMMALAVRQAWRKGAQVFIVDADGKPLVETMGITVKSAASLAEISIGNFKSPVLVCGMAAAETGALEEALATGAKLAFLLRGPNSFGAAMLHQEHACTNLADAIATGEIKGMIAVEADVPAELTARLSFVAVAGHRGAKHLPQTSIFLPTTTTIEMNGTFINNEGRAQRFKRVMQPGVPVKGLDPALHPPHVHRNIPPGADVRPAWRIVADLIEGFGGKKVGEPFTGKWLKLRDVDAEAGGLSILEGSK